MCAFNIHNPTARAPPRQARLCKSPSSSAYCPVPRTLRTCDTAPQVRIQDGFELAITRWPSLKPRQACGRGPEQVPVQCLLPQPSALALAMGLAHTLAPAFATSIFLAPILANELSTSVHAPVENKSECPDFQRCAATGGAIIFF